MDISDTVSFFATQKIYDAYSGLWVFDGHFDVYDNSVRDSLTGGRRTVTIIPGADIPARRVISYETDIFIIGDHINDYHKNEILKKYLVLHPADGLASVGTSAQMLSGSGATDVYVGRSWRKSQKEEAESSEMFNLFNFYVAQGESGERNSLILLSGRYYRIQGFEDTTGGFSILVASELGADAVKTVSYTPASGAYDPASDAKSVSDPFNISAFVERYQTSYRYNTPSSVKYESGDIIATFLKSDVADPETNDRVNISGLEYKLISAVDDLNGAWEAHLRVM